MSTGSIRAGHAAVELFIDDSPMMRGLKAASAKLKAWGTSLSSIGKRIGGFGALATTGLFAAAKAAADAGSTLLEMSQRTGVSVESLSTMGYALEQSGSDLDTFEKSIRKMQQSLVDGNKAFALLGLSATELRKLDAETQFLLIADALSKVEDEALRTSIAMDIFGKSGTMLLPALEGGIDALQKLRKEFAPLATTMQEAIDAESFGDDLSKLWKTVKQGVIALGTGLIPAMKQVAEIVQPLVQGVAVWLRQNPELAAGLLAAAAGMMAFGGAALLVGTALSGLGSIVGAIAGIVKVLGSMGPIGWLVTAAAGVGTAWASQSSSIRQSLGSIGDAIKSTLGGVTQALKSGDMEMAGEIAMQGLVVIFREGLDGIKNAFREFWNDISNVSHEGSVNLGITLKRSFQRLAGGLSFLGGVVTAEEMGKSFRILDEQLEKEKKDAINEGRTRFHSRPSPETIAARKKLEELLSRVADATGGANGDNVPESLKRIRDEMKNVAMAVSNKLPDAIVKGTQEFANEALKQRFGGNEATTIQERQLEEARRTNRNLNDIERELHRLPQVGAANL